MQLVGVTNEKNSRPISLPADVVDRVETRVSITNFESVEEYIAYTLEEVLNQVEDELDEPPSEIDETQVTDRLRSLGYLEE